MLRMCMLRAMCSTWCLSEADQQPAIWCVRFTWCAEIKFDLSMSTATASIRKASFQRLVANRNIGKVVQGSLWTGPHFSSSFQSVVKYGDLLVCISSISADFLTIQTVRLSSYFLHLHQKTSWLYLMQIYWLAWSDQIRSSARVRKAKEEQMSCS